MSMEGGYGRWRHNGRPAGAGDRRPNGWRDRRPDGWPHGWPLPLVQFVELFNRGEFWESHEVLETPWRVNRSDFYQGLIIYASAFVHAKRGNPVGIRKQMAKLPGKLDKYRPHYMGIDVNAVLTHARTCSDMVSVPEPLRGPALTAAVPYPKLTLAPQLVRGDEPEFHDGTNASPDADS